MYKNYIFDFGMVIVNFNPDYMTKQYIKDEKDREVAKEVIFDRLYWDKLDKGTITDEELMFITTGIIICHILTVCMTL